MITVLHIFTYIRQSTVFCGYARERNFNIQFVWIPSHVGIRKHEHVDNLAKEVCNKDIVNIDLGMPLAKVAHILKSSHKEELIDLTSSQRPESCSIRHYDQYRDCKPSYLCVAPK